MRLSLLLCASVALVGAPACDRHIAPNLPPQRVSDAALTNPPDTVIRDATVPPHPVDAAPIVDARAPHRSLPVGIELGPYFNEADAGTVAGDAQMLALGVKAVVLHVPFADYDLQSPGSAARWATLSDRAHSYSQAGAEVVIALDLVERTVTLRPADLTTGWFSGEMRTRLQELIDHLYELMASDIRALTFGDEVDRYLSVTADPTRSQFQQLLLYGLRYAREHQGARPQGDRTVPVTIALDATLSGWLQALAGDAGATPLQALIPEIDALAVNYLPLDAAAHAVADDQALEPLRQLALAAGPHPVLLQEVSYPSDQTVSSSEVRQASFYRRLFDLLTTDGEPFTLLSISPHTDPSAADCAAQAATYSQPTSSLIAARCSLGLWRHNGQPKAAWSVVLGGISSFYSP
ncbi:MAG TPA: hypothetical protein VL137_11265 [Polyangiaceae bacterium]|nr:hypothetical protein [Polyangiaceae bacterium]